MTMSSGRPSSSSQLEWSPSIASCMKCSSVTTLRSTSDETRFATGWVSFDMVNGPNENSISSTPSRTSADAMISFILRPIFTRDDRVRP